MARPIYGEDDWPRDFPGLMYLGTLVHFLNVAMHPDAERADAVLAPFFEDRPSSHNPARLETPAEQTLAHHRAMQARGAALKGMRDGTIEPTWLDRDGMFQPVPAATWQPGASDSDLASILVRFSLPPRLMPDDEAVVFGNAPCIYVPASQAEAAVAAINSRTCLPSVPAKILERVGSGATAIDTLWSVGAAAVWVATRDVTLARGAHRYKEQMAGVGFAEVQEGALALLAREEIAFHYCRCRRPICRCWNDALRDITAQAEVGSLVGRGFKNDAGNMEDVPKGAWSGSIQFGECARIEPRKPGGDRWTNIIFEVSDLVRLFPGAPVRPEARNPPTSAMSKGDAIHRLAQALDAEGVAIRDVKATLIASRWAAADGKPPKVEAVTMLMTGGQKGRPGKMSDD